MIYYIGQALGICSTICCLILPLFQKKWQMLIVNAAINLFCALNLIMIGQGGLVIGIYVVAVAQSLVMLWHVLRDVPVKKSENIVFLLLYLGCGAISVRGILDVLPAGGALFSMLATFQKDVQKTRVFLLCNALAFLVYYGLVGAAAVFSPLCTIITTTIAMWRHRKKQTA